MDLKWLIIPLAVGVFALRAVMLARRLKTAARDPTLADIRAHKDARQNLRVHREELDAVLASPKAHLASAKRLSRRPAERSRRESSNLDRMVEDFLPERRF